MDVLLLKGLNLLWHLSNAFSGSALEASIILYFLDLFRENSANYRTRTLKSLHELICAYTSRVCRRFTKLVHQHGGFLFL